MVLRLKEITEALEPYPDLHNTLPFLDDEWFVVVHCPCQMQDTTKLAFNCNWNDYLSIFIVYNFSHKCEVMQHIVSHVADKCDINLWQEK